MADIEDYTNGAIMWSETAGLKQLSRRRELDDGEARLFITNDFKRDNLRRAA